MTPGASLACCSLGHTLFVPLVPGPGLTHTCPPADPRTLPAALWEAPEPELCVPVKGFQSSNPAFRALRIPAQIPAGTRGAGQWASILTLLSGLGTLLSKRLCNHPGGK